MAEQTNENDNLTSAGGWTCPKCGAWVYPSDAHVCGGPVNEHINYFSWNVNYDMEILDELRSIKSILEFMAELLERLMKRWLA